MHTCCRPARRGRAKSLGRLCTLSMVFTTASGRLSRITAILFFAPQCYQGQPFLPQQHCLTWSSRWHQAEALPSQGPTLPSPPASGQKRAGFMGILTWWVSRQEPAPMPAAVTHAAAAAAAAAAEDAPREEPAGPPSAHPDQAGKPDGELSEGLLQLDSAASHALTRQLCR